jgi:hypothetical protein
MKERSSKLMDWKWWRIIQPGQAVKLHKMNYYDHPYVSNSKLSTLKMELSNQDARDYQAALDFGILFHAVLLEPHTVDLIRRRVEGRDFEYSKEDLYTVRKMRDSFRNDPFCDQLWCACDKEVEMYTPGASFEHEGVEFTLDIKCKYDLFNSQVGWGADPKTTTATSQSAFEAAITQFDYDRSRIFYSKNSGAIQDVIIGVSKVAPYRVFKVFMKAGDKLWQSGERKMSELAFRWWVLQEVTV